MDQFYFLKTDRLQPTDQQGNVYQGSTISPEYAVF